MVFYNFGDFLLVSFPISLFRLLHNFKVAKANKKGARLLNFSHFPGEMVWNFLEEHFNCNEFRQSFEHQFIGDQNSKYAAEMLIWWNIDIMHFQKFLMYFQD